jgi:hypothetical protein
MADKKLHFEINEECARAMNNNMAWTPETVEKHTANNL